MTKFKDVKVGDRVRLTHENGDRAEFAVTTSSPLNVSGKWRIGTETNNYWEKDGWRIEILEKSLPARHNAMIGHPIDKCWCPYIYNAIMGVWFEAGSTETSEEITIREMMRAHGFVVLYEGIE